MNLRFELSFVDFDDQGEPHPVGSLENPTKRRLLPVLYEGDEWKGPLWRRDERNNLVAITSLDLVRMNHYAYELDVPDVTTERLEASKHKEWFYVDKDKRRHPVPAVETKDGKEVSIRNIPRG